jgi:putative zinc finger protein
MNPTEDDVLTPACEATRPLIDQFAERTLSADDATAMRAHIVACAACSDYYRTSVESAGRAGAAAREVRERREAGIEHQRRLRESVEGQREPKKHRNFRIRTMLMPAFFAFLIFQIYKAQDRGPRFVVDGAIGDVEVTGRPFASYGQNEVVMRRGSRCVTGKNSSARMVTGDKQFELGANSELLITDFEPPRARLFVGELRIQGPCEIETLLGNVIVDGDTASGRVLFEANGLLVVADSGDWIFQNAGGEQVIPAGEDRRFRP